MLSIRKKLFKNRKGFTLIELIVVIAILAILAVLAVPRFLGTLENARQRTDEATARTIVSAYALADAARVDSAGTVISDADLDLGTVTVADLVGWGFLDDEPDSATTPGTGFTITDSVGDGTGTMQITVGTEIMYPVQ